MRYTASLSFIILFNVLTIKHAIAQANEGASTQEALPEVPVAAVDEAEPSLQVSASFFTRMEIREGYATIGKTQGRISESDFVRYRARFGLHTSPIEIAPGRTIALSFEPQASGYWGEKAGTLSDGALNIHAAKLRLQEEAYWIDVGRFEMAYGEHLVIGTVDWHETARSFDGVRTRIKLGASDAWLDAFVTQVQEDPNLAEPIAAADQYFAGVYSGLGSLLDPAIELDAYALTQVSPKTEGMASTDFRAELTLGTRFKKTTGNFDVRVETGLQLGLGDASKTAYQADAEVGAALLSKQMRLAAGGWYASGDDPNTSKNEGWDQLYPTAHKFLGFADIIGGRSNIMGGIGRVRYKPVTSLSLGTDLHVFWRPQTAPGVASYTGTELDAWGQRKLGKGLGLRLGYSVFAPNQAGSYASSALVHYVEVQLRYDLVP